jgi:hypothetical protein
MAKEVKICVLYPLELCTCDCEGRADIVKARGCCEHKPKWPFRDSIETFDPWLEVGPEDEHAEPKTSTG